MERPMNNRKGRELRRGSSKLPSEYFDMSGLNELEWSVVAHIAQLLDSSPCVRKVHQYLSILISTTIDCRVNSLFQKVLDPGYKARGYLPNSLTAWTMAA